MFFIKMMSLLLKKYQFPLMCLLLSLMVGCGSGGLKSMSLRTSKDLPNQSEPQMKESDNGKITETLDMQAEPTDKMTSASENKSEGSSNKKSKTSTHTENEKTSPEKELTKKQDDDLRELLGK